MRIYRYHLGSHWVTSAISSTVTAYMPPGMGLAAAYGAAQSFVPNSTSKNGNITSVFKSNSHSITNNYTSINTINVVVALKSATASVITAYSVSSNSSSSSICISSTGNSSSQLPAVTD